MGRPCSEDAFNAELADLRTDLEAVRKKHGLANLVCVAAQLRDDNGFGIVRSLTPLGNPAEAEQLLEWGWYAARSERWER
jgi:hypothetical protein